MRSKIPFHGPALEFLGIELIYFIAIVAMSLYIYFKSREIFNLTKHKGVDYFSNIFLFFSLAYLLRLFAIFSMMSHEIIGIDILRLTFGLDFLLMGYFSTVAIIYLILSSMHGAIKKKFEPPESLIHVSAIVFSLFVLMTQSSAVMLMAQVLIILISAVLMLIMSKEKSKTFTINKFSFFLLFGFWALSTIVLMVELPFIAKLLLYAISAAVFTSFFLRVRRRLA